MHDARQDQRELLSIDLVDGVAEIFLDGAREPPLADIAGDEAQNLPFHLTSDFLQRFRAGAGSSWINGRLRHGGQFICRGAAGRPAMEAVDPLAPPTGLHGIDCQTLP